MSVETTALTTTEQKELDAHIATVKEGQAAFVRVAEALMQIKEKHLWRASSETFEDFCQAEFGFSRRQGDRLIASAAVVKRLGHELDPVGPISERVARAVGKAPESEQREVFREAVATAPKKNGKAHVTAKHVDKVRVKRVEPDPAPATDTMASAAPKLDPKPWEQHNADAQRVIALMDEYVALVDRMAETPFGGWVDLKAHRGWSKDTRLLFEKWQVVGFKPQWEIGADGRNFYYAFEKKGGKK